MSEGNAGNQRAVLEALPKIELHRHLEGAIRLTTLIDVAKKYHIEIPSYEPGTLRPHVQITPDSPASPAHFLSKFAVIRRFFCAPEVIQRIAREAVEDAASDNIKYMELRLTPKALTNLRNYAFSDVVKWVSDGVVEGQAGHDIRVRMILSMNRHESVADGERTLRCAVDFKRKGVVALDLAGQEASYSADPFIGLFREALQEGLGVTVHAGEWFGPENIRDAILKIGTQRIGHGVRIIEDDNVVQMARDAGIVFEVCTTSNVQSGVVPDVARHPLRQMMLRGLRTTINTDDPAISGITLTDEMQLAQDALGMSMHELRHATLVAAASAFLPQTERTALIDYFAQALRLYEEPDKTADRKAHRHAESTSPE